MASQAQMFGYPGNLTEAQLEEGWAHTTHCFVADGGQDPQSTTESRDGQREVLAAPKFSDALPFRPANAVRQQHEEPPSTTRTAHALPLQPMNGERMAKESLDTISAMQVDEAEGSASSDATSQHPKKFNAEKSTFHFTVKMPNGIESAYLITASGEKKLIYETNSLGSGDSISNDADREPEPNEPDPPAQRPCTTPRSDGHDLPHRYEMWLCGGQRGPAPQHDSNEFIKSYTRPTGGYTRALEPQGSWDDDLYNEFFHPCLPNVTYILGRGENQYEVEAEMIEQYGFML